MAYKNKTGVVMIGDDGLPLGLAGIQELAKFFSVHPITIRRWTETGRLPKPFKSVNKREVWQWRDINNLVEQLKNQAAPV